MQMDGDMMSSGEGKQVCVTGASGYIASWLVNQLLLRGYTVNATVRDPDNVSSRHLFALQPAANHRLRLFKADLLDDGSFDDSINGCDGVFHTASPCFFDSQNPQRWYALSKTLAEETAWRYAKEKGIDLVSINPGYVIGPLLQPKINESCAKTYSNISYRVVHVKDVADAHIQALEIESANGRYCLVESVARVCETLEILRDLYPTLPLSNKCEKDTPSRLTCNVSKEKAKSLGIDFIPFRTTLKEMIHRFNENNFISF